MAQTKEEKIKEEEEEIDFLIKKYEARCVCTEERYCNPCRIVDKLKEIN